MIHVCKFVFYISEVIRYDTAQSLINDQNEKHFGAIRVDIPIS